MTRIAVLGWGSLVWDPKDLAFGGLWSPTGPCLHVEFARCSQDQRVTLVLVESAEYSRTYTAMSTESTVDGAAENLRWREGRTKTEFIHVIDGDGARDMDDKSVSSRSTNEIARWLKASKDYDAAVWTALPAKGFSSHNLAKRVTQHIQRLDPEQRGRAREYVQKAPTTVDTVVRRAVEGEFGWSRIGPPAEVLSDEPGEPCT